MRTVKTVTLICDLRPNPWGFILLPVPVATDMAPDATLAARRRYNRAKAHREALQVIRESFAA